jgi:hypothetical protein
MWSDGQRQRHLVPCEKGVGDGGSLRGHFAHAVGFAQMGDERERPVTWGHRIDVPRASESGATVTLTPFSCRRGRRGRIRPAAANDQESRSDSSEHQSWFHCPLLGLRLESV